MEQYWRDNRLNMIHEGTHGIQAIDLLGRKMTMQGGRGVELLGARLAHTIERARRVPALAGHAEALQAAWAEVVAAARAAWSRGEAAAALANATPFMQAFGHTVVAWIWLEVALCVCEQLALAHDDPLLRGRLAACRYFFRHELPRIGAWLQVVAACDDTCLTMHEDGF